MISSQKSWGVHFFKKKKKKKESKQKSQTRNLVEKYIKV
jgi:hypothetical protein